MDSISGPLWRPSPARIEAASVTTFRRRVETEHEVSLPDSKALHAWSVEHPERYWLAVWEFCEVVAQARGDVVLASPDAMPGARFFPEARLNFAANLLRCRGPEAAIVSRVEGIRERTVSWDALHAEVGALSAALRAMGVARGDRVAGYLPNVPEAIVAMLATASLGAVWTSCSPDFGERGIVDRFGQVAPRVLFCTDGYYYKGKPVDVQSRVAGALAELPSVEHVVVSPILDEGAASAGIRTAIDWSELIEDHVGTAPRFDDVAFNDPLYILYSSGTTGPPKCIVHGVGGTLLKHLAEHRLMCDIQPRDRVFYYTTCGWMMWNWLVSALASEATLLLYDGNPMAAGPDTLFEFAATERCTFFGTSAKFIDSLARAGARPGASNQMPRLRTIASTGSPLSSDGFRYVYEHVHPDVCLASIAGGTDIVGCFVGGDPVGPVWAGEIQAPVLGMAVDVFDAEGRPLRGGKGELVCTRPFPSMPVCFWNDADGSRYRAAYFERFPGIWHHGDFVEVTEHDGYVIHGRSDATLNPGGVRIGTSEIYRVVERDPAVAEAVVIGQPWDGDVRIVLFVVMAEGHELRPEIAGRLRDVIRRECSPRHVPARILAVPDIPRTKSGKIVELAVRDAVMGEPLRNATSLANPNAIAHFRGLAELSA